MRDISEAFNIPIEILENHTSYENFVEKAKKEYREHKKYSKGMGLTRTGEPIPNKRNLLAQLKKHADEWHKSDFQYSIVEERGKMLKPYTVLDFSFWGDDLKELEKAFLLMVAIHYNAGWEKWTLLNIDNKSAIKAMIKGLHVNYWLTRFRILYALQKMSLNDIKEELDKSYNKNLSDNTLDVIKTHVFSHTVVDFLKKIANNKNTYVAGKAKNVLAEIADRWKDAAAGLKSPL